MAESSTMEGPSNPNPEKLFQFTITPFNKFKNAINSLIDDEFNSITYGVIEVHEAAVDFRVQNVNTKVTALLRLDSIALKDFYFNERCKGKRMRVNFRTIYLNLTDFFDWVTFSHFDGSDNIVVNLGEYPVKKFDVTILSIVPEIERFFIIESICDVEFLSESLREILNHLELPGNHRLVTVDMSEKLVTVNIKDNPQPWILFNYDDDNQVGKTRGMEPEQKHQARFNWHHLEALKKASNIGPTSDIGFVVKPKGMIMTRFSLGDFRDLVFVDKAATIIINAHLIDKDAPVL